MNKSRGLSQPITIWRWSLPLGLVILIALIALVSIAGVVAERNGFPLVQSGILVPSLVWEGQAWRLITWPLFELHPINLIFAGLLLYWFGREFCERFGTGKFLAIFFGLAVVIGIFTCLVGRFVWHEVNVTPVYGTWPLTEAMVIAWAAFYPAREIFLYLVIRVSGKNLILLTIGMTVLFAIFQGFAQFVPHFFAEAIALVYTGQASRWYKKWRFRRMQNKMERYVANVERIDRMEQQQKQPKSPPKWMN